MGRFMAKPITIDAERWLGNMWLDEPGGVIDQGLDAGVLFLGKDGALTVRTLVGDVTAIAGDWIVKGPKDEHYVCSTSIFEATYSDGEGDAYEDDDERVLYSAPAKAICEARVIADRQLPKSRETSLVLTKLDEALLWLSQVPVER